MAKFLTDKGREKLLTASPLNPVQIKSIVVGTGTGTAAESITALKAEVWRGNASDPIKQGTKLGFTTLIPLDVGSWSLTEWGWIDSAGDLIAYGQFDTAVYKEAGSMTLEPTLYIELTNSIDSNIFITDSLNWPHNNFTGRNNADAHNIASITDLQTALDNKLGKTENAVSASKLQNARTIGGVSFDGTENINLPGVNAVGNQSTSGNAASATKLANIRSLSFSGAVTGSMNFDGSANSSAVLTLANSGVAASTYGSNLKIPVITVNAKGLITGVSEKAIPEVVDASTEQKGISKLNNTLTSTSVAEALTANMGRELALRDFGVGQTRKKDTLILNTTYTNTSQKPWFVSMTTKNTSSGRSAFLVLKVDGKEVAVSQDVATSYNSGSNVYVAYVTIEQIILPGESFIFENNDLGYFHCSSEIS